MSIDAVIADKVRASFEAQTMMQTLGATLENIGAGTCTIAAPLLPGSLQQQGAAHAALTFAIGDSAAGYAALTLMEADAEVMTVEMKINLLRPATGPLLAHGEVVKAGKRLTVARAHVLSGEKEVAVLQGTMIPVTR